MIKGKITTKDWADYLTDIIGKDKYVAYEVGVATYAVSRLKDLFNNTKSEFHLFEPLPEYFKDLKNNINQDNVQLHNVAIYKESGEFEFNEYGQESHINTVISPAVSRGRLIQHKHIVKSHTIDEFDKGNIDILLIDAEGCEWYVLEKLISKPKIIALELTTAIRDFVHPHIELVEGWMYENNYELKDVIGGDYIYIKQ
jgi:FkbM family methyltransferase